VESVPTSSFPSPVQIPTLGSRRVTGSKSRDSRLMHDAFVSRSQQNLAGFFRILWFWGGYLCFYEQQKWAHSLQLEAAGCIAWKLGMRGHCASHVCVAAAARRSRTHLEAARHTKTHSRAPAKAAASARTYFSSQISISQRRLSAGMIFMCSHQPAYMLFFLSSAKIHLEM
jgi:hypothetical protein